jgi:xanthine dehydrogenase YagS FAD-binding subunit
VNPFTYARAARPEEAVAAVAGDRGAKFLAGGTTLVDLLRLGVETPSALVDVNPLPLTRIESLPGGGLLVGANVKNSDLANDANVRRRYPVLSEAILAGASPQIRNMASVGGNLMQRTRCFYFRDPVYACNKRRPGSGCAALDGYNRIHAVLGTSERCIATHPGDMAVALMALEAVVHTRQPNGAGQTTERAIPIDRFFVAYGEDPARENVLEHGELITGVELPPAPWLARSHYLKVRDRASYEFALAAAAVALDLAGDGTVRAARVALGGVATKPWRSSEAERTLLGRKADATAFRAAGEAALAGARPQKHNGFKVELAKRTVARALATAATLRTA